MAAAVELFLEVGFAETRMEEIAARADVAKGTLYRYFPTKAAMLEAVLTQVIAGPLVGISTLPFNEGEPVQAFLRRVLLPVLRKVKGSQLEGLFRLIIVEATRHPEIAAVYRRTVLDPMTAFLRSLAIRAREGGELRSNSTALERFPLLLMAPGLMATAWNGLHGKEDQISAGDAFEALLELVFLDEERGSALR
ncbi:TetR/AcrR family transcriptional regulator [Rhodoplanes roseus]|uniref:TetR/AcrR family transcriptional regulator n=1 Tax=Rhodoplanes roseus TaxID=29409 RepID=UPI001472E5B9|nr:TetR/AcrR family transcriptional regulator [Rhodoplanes roseus]